MKKVLLLIWFMGIFHGTGIKADVSLTLRDAKNCGMGSAGVAVPHGVTSLYFNPALLMENEYTHFLFEFQDTTDIDDSSIYIAYTRVWSDNMTAGFGFTRIGANKMIMYDQLGRLFFGGSIINNLLYISPAFRINQYFSLGLNVKMINLQVFHDHDTAFDLDTGFLFKPLKNLRLGVNVMNLLTTKLVINGAEIREPFNIRGGVSYTFNLKDQKIILAGDFNTSDISLFAYLYAFGLEYNLMDRYFLRMGYNEIWEFCAGGGTRYEDFEMNYSFEQLRDYHNHKVSVTYYFKQNLSSEKIDILYNRGIISYNSSNYSKAFDIFKKVSDTDKDYKDTFSYLEALKQKMNIRKQEANDRFVKADKYYKNGENQFEKDQLNESVENLIQCLKIYPNHTRAKELLSRVRKKQQKASDREKSRVREKEGDRYYLDSQYSSALVEYEKAAALSPDNEQLQEKIKKVKNNLKNLDVDMISKNLCKEGMNYFNKGHFQKAISKYQEALVVNPNSGEIKENIKIAEIKIMEKEETKTLDLIINDEIIDQLQIARELLNRKKYSRAMFKIEEILELDPGNKEAVSLKEKISVLINNKKKMDSKEKEKLEKQHLTGGLMEFKKGNHEQALYHFARVISLSPEKGQSIKELNTVLNQMSEWESSGINEDSPYHKLIKTHYQRGMGFYNEKNYDMALAEWKRVHSIVPDNIKIKTKIEETTFLALKKQEHQKKTPKNNTSVEKMSKKKKIEKDMILAEKYYENKNYNSAREKIEKVLKNESENKKAGKLIKKIKEKEQEENKIAQKKKKIIDLQNRGIKSYSQGTYNGCIREMNELLTLAPNNKQAIELVQKAKTKLNEKSKPKPKPKPKKKVNTKIVYQHYLKGINHYTTGDIDQAISEWNLALKLDPRNPKIKKSLDKAYAKRKMLN